MRPARARGEAGNVLTLTLVFTVVFVLLIGGVTYFSATASLTGNIAHDRRSEIQAADNAMVRAVQAAVEKVKADGFVNGGLSDCTFGAPFVVPSTAEGEDDIEVDVECTVVSASSSPPATPGNRPEWAILALSNTSKAIHQPVGSPTFVVQGPIWSNGTIELLGKNREGRVLKVVDGVVSAKCDPGNPADWQRVLIVDPDFQEQSCPTSPTNRDREDEVAKFPLPAGFDPGTMPSPAVPGPCSAANRVATFSPGYYDDTKLGEMNARFADTAAATKCEVFHFLPGVYLFAWGNAELKMSGTVIAGTPVPGALDPPSNPNPPYPGACQRWSGGGDPAESQGALFLFANKAQIGLYSGHAEFCPYHLNEADPNNGQHVSFRAIISEDGVTGSAWSQRRLAGGASMTTSGFANPDGVNGPVAGDGNVASAAIAGGSSSFVRAPLATPIPPAASLEGLTLNVTWKWTGSKPEYLRVRLVDEAGNNLSCQGGEAPSNSFNVQGVFATSTISVPNCWWKPDAGQYIKQPGAQVKVEVKAKNGNPVNVEIDDVIVNVLGSSFGAWNPPANNNRYLFDNKTGSEITVWGTVVAPDADIALRGDAFQCGDRGYLRGLMASKVTLTGGVNYQRMPAIATPSQGGGEATATVILKASIDGRTLIATRAHIRVVDDGNARVADPVTHDYWLVDGSVDEIGDLDEVVVPSEQSCE